MIYMKQKPPLGAQIDWSDPINRGLVGYWLMNEGAGNRVNDLSGNGNTGQLAGTATWQVSGLGPSLLLDGDSDYISISFTSLPQRYPMSMVCWFRLNAVTTDQTIISLGRNATAGFVRLYVVGTSTGKLVAQVQNDIGDFAGNAVSAVACDANKWHMGVGVYHSNTLREVYLDGGNYGSQANYCPCPTPIYANVGVLQRLAFMHYLAGSVGFATIYARALSASEIARLYRDPFGGLRGSYDYRRKPL